MAAAANQNFVTFAGDDVQPVFTVQNGDGVAIDISTVQAIQWSAQLNSDDAAVITKSKAAGGITFVTNGTDGQFQVAIDAADTTPLKGWYTHTATITDSLGKVTTVSIGRMQVGPKPDWTYNPALIESVPLYQVRRWLGDVIEQDPQMSDSEIRYAITQRSTTIGAAADCARQLAAQYSRKVDVTSPGEIKTAYGTQAKKYADLAKDLDQINRSRGAGVMPYAGGISIQDKISVQNNSDRVQPNFTIGMTDNQIPVASVGPETPTVISNTGLG